MKKIYAAHRSFYYNQQKADSFSIIAKKRNGCIVSFPQTISLQMHFLFVPFVERKQCKREKKGWAAMITKIAYLFWLLCLSVFLSGVVWTTSKGSEHERIMHSVVHKVQIQRMYDTRIYDTQL